MLKRLVCFAIRLYQLFLSPFLGGQCRFEPSCSRYALLAVERFGAARGSWLALKRLSRCQPFCSQCGYDPPPEIEPSTSPGMERGAAVARIVLDPVGMPRASAGNG